MPESASNNIYDAEHVRHFLIISGLGPEVDDLMEWANKRGLYSREEMDFLRHMDFLVRECQRCRNKCMTGDADYWEELSGAVPKNTSMYRVEITIVGGKGIEHYTWQICHDCYRQLHRFFA